MATTYTDNGGGAANGSDLEFTFTFPVIQTEDVKVALNGVAQATTKYAVNLSSNPTKITFNNTSVDSSVQESTGAPKSGVNVRVYRQTTVGKSSGDDDPKAVFAAGSSIRAADLNANQEQSLYAIHELQTQPIIDEDIEAGAITNAKLATNAVTTIKIADDAVTTDKLANSINTEIAANTAKVTNATHTGDVTGATSLTIAQDAVTTSKIAADAIVSAKIADNAINSEHYTNGSIDTEHIADDAVTDAKLANSINTAIAANTAKNTNVSTNLSTSTTTTAVTVASSDGTNATIGEATNSAAGVMSSAHHDKLDGIEASATADQTNAEIRAAVEAATDSNVFTDADHSKLNAIEASATADQTASEIKTLYESNSDTNEFSNAEQTKLAGIEASATADQTNAEIRAAVEAASDSNVFTDADHSKLNAIEASATADQTASEIKTLLQSDKLTVSEINTTSTDGRYYTETELDAGQLDNRYYTKTESESRYYNLASGEEIQSGETWSAADNKIATTAAIDARIIDLVDDVGGFVPIANETSFPNANPDVNNGAGTIVSIGSLSSNLTSNGSGVISISNGTVGNSTVTITGAENSTTYSAGYGLLVETTTTLNTYTFHRLSSKATEVTTVAGSISSVNTVAGSISNVNSVAGNTSNINTVASNNTNVTNVGGNISNVNAVAGNATNINAVAADATDIGAVAGKATEIGRLGTADAVSDLNTLGTADVVSDMNTLATSAVVSDMDTLADISSNITTVAGISSNVTSVANNSSNINSAVSNASNINAAVSNASNINTVAGNNSNITTVAGANSNITAVAGANSNISTVAGSIANVNTTATNIANVNNFAGTYQIASSNPSTDGGGNSLAAGDLYFNTSANELKVYNGSAWQGGVTATGNLAGLGSNTFTGNQDHDDSVKARFGTGEDADISHDGTNFLIHNGTGNLNIHSSNVIKLGNYNGLVTHLTATPNQGIDLYYDNSKKFETASGGVSVTGNIVVSGTVDGVDIAALNSTVSGITSNATHSGEVTGSGALTIADNVVDEANLKVSNSPSNGYFLQAQSGNTGGLTWAEVSAGVTSDAQYNTLAGTNAGDSFSGTSATNNTLYGYNAGTALTTGDNNVIIGSEAGKLIDTESNNVLIGYEAGTKNDIESCTFVGYQAGKDVTGDGNIAIGDSALGSTTSGSSNVAIGSYAGNSLASGEFNISLGGQAIQYGQNRDFNIGIGQRALRVTTADHNIAIGYQSCWSSNSISGASNVFLGSNNAQNNLSSGSNNLCLGYNVGQSITTGSNNIVLGSEAEPTSATTSNEITLGDANITKLRVPGINVTLKDNGGTPTNGHVLTVDSNGEAGFAAVAAGVTSDSQQNTVAGTNAGDSITSGTDNIAIGYDAMSGGTLTGNNNIAIGLEAGENLTSGGGNVCIGKYAGEEITTAYSNTLVGTLAGDDITTGGQNSIFGAYAGGALTTGASNVAIGYGTLGTATTGFGNVAIGESAMESSTGYNTVAIGRYAMKRHTSSIMNTAVGVSSLEYTTTGEKTTAVGYNAGYSHTTGQRNVLIGHFAGDGAAYGSSNLTTGSNNIIIGSQAGPSSSTVNNEITLGDTNITKFRVPGINVTLKDNGGTPTDGQVLTVDSNGEAGFADAGGGFPSGTVMLFAQTSAPTGWTKSTTHNNKALRVVSGSVGSGGNQTFNTIFADRSLTANAANTTTTGTVGSHTLTTSEMPSHSHVVPGASSSNLNYGPIRNLVGRQMSYNSVNTNSTGGGGSHSHGFTGSAHNHSITVSNLDMQVQYVDVILATKD